MHGITATYINVVSVLIKELDAASARVQIYAKWVNTLCYC